MNYIRNKLLAYTGRTRDQYAYISLGNTLSLLDYLLHYITLVYEVTVTCYCLLKLVGIFLKLGYPFLIINYLCNIIEQIDGIAKLSVRIKYRKSTDFKITFLRC